MVLTVSFWYLEQVSFWYLENGFMSYFDTWSQWRDLNPQPSDYRSDALPLSYYWQSVRINRIYTIYPRIRN